MTCPQIKICPHIKKVLMLLWFCCLTNLAAASETIRVGSKAFTESHILAELAAQLLESEGYKVERKLGLGGTLIAFEALSSDNIDFYPEYSGTLSQTILKQPGASVEQLNTALQQQGLRLVSHFGFNNSYAIAVSGDIARKYKLTKISDLEQHPDLRLGVSLEFLNRADGWPALSRHYRLPHRASGLEHALAYRAIESGQLDMTDAYTTDGDLDAFDLVVLEDDEAFFPRYMAALLARDDLPEPVIAILDRLSNSLTEEMVRLLNRKAAKGGQSPYQIAADFLSAEGFIRSAPTEYADDKNGSSSSGLWESVFHHIAVHLQLTGIALALACLFALPVAILLSRYRNAAKAVLYVAGLIQTIPSLALLALMIPLVGLGALPAIIALFLYSLLPIIRNTLTGLFSVDPLLKQVAMGMGLTPWQQLRKIEIPLALPTILAGIKTAAIISIGTATLAAFVGAGGLGEPIITGLTLNDHQLILQGAIPAALLAMLAEFLFELLERRLVLKHLISK